MGKTYGNTFTNDQHPSLRADYILANPPFNISNWGGEQLADDPRWKWGVPPVNNANYAWLQHMLSRLAGDGRAGIVLANGSMTTNTSNEGVIRKAMVDDDMVECMVALPGQLFTNTQIPVCLWFLSKDKTAGKKGNIDRRNEVLFIDCRDMGKEQVSRVQIAFTDDEIHEIAQTYHRWRGTAFADEKAYEDVKGFCQSATLEDIAKHDYTLTPGRYVGAAEVEDDGEPFAEKMTRLTEQLREQFAESARLETEIKRNLGGLGYGL